MLQGNSNCIMNDSNEGSEKPIDSTARAKFLEEHPPLKSRFKTQPQHIQVHSPLLGRIRR